MRGEPQRALRMEGAETRQARAKRQGISFFNWARVQRTPRAVWKSQGLGGNETSWHQDGAETC
jgi:hypothetical protein